MLFSNGVKSADYKNIRIYGTGLFGILEFLSFLILGILQIYWIMKSNRSLQTHSYQKQILGTHPPRQLGMNLIIVYQMLLGGLMIIDSIIAYII